MAVSSLNGVLHIAANEFHEKTNDSIKAYQYITSIANFFLNFLESSSYEERKDILMKIGSGRYHYKKVNVPKELSGDTIIGELFEGVNPTVSELVKRYGKHADVAGSVWAICRKLYRAFTKVEETLKNELAPSTPIPIASSSATSSSSGEVKTLMKPGNYCLMNI